MPSHVEMDTEPMIGKVGPKGEVTIPRAVRDAVGIRARTSSAEAP